VKTNSSIQMIVDSPYLNIKGAD